MMMSCKMLGMVESFVWVVTTNAIVEFIDRAAWVDARSLLPMDDHDDDACIAIGSSSRIGMHGHYSVLREAGRVGRVVHGSVCSSTNATPTPRTPRLPTMSR